jgi:hypothetical protein
MRSLHARCGRTHHARRSHSDAQPLAGGHASIRNTLVHAMSAEWGWMGRFGGPRRGILAPRRALRNYCPSGALSLCQLVFYHLADLYFKAVPDSFSATEALT